MDTEHVTDAVKSDFGLSLIVKISAVMMFTIIFLTAMQVFLRYVMGFSLSWIEEVSRYLFVWIVMLGAVIAFALNQHIAVDVISERMGPRGLRLLEIARTLLSMAAVGLILYSGVLVAWRHRSSTFYTLQGFPAVFFYIAVPVGAVLMLWFLAIRIRRLLAAP